MLNKGGIKRFSFREKLPNVYIGVSSLFIEKFLQLQLSGPLALRVTGTNPPFFRSTF